MVQTIFTSWAAFSSIHKDVLSIFQQRNLIYKFQWCCNTSYIGRTSQCPEVRVKQHVPRDIHNHTTWGHSKFLNSAICEHLNALNSCAVNYNNKCFGVFFNTILCVQNFSWITATFFICLTAGHKLLPTFPHSRSNCQTSLATDGYKCVFLSKKK